jgi:hypothetical protein
MEAESVCQPKKSLGVCRRDHRFEEFSFTVGALKIAMTPCHTDRCKTVFFEREVFVLVRNRTGNGKGEFIPEMGLSKSESFGSEVV